MKKFAVIGHPVTHSKSPELHQAGFHEMQIDAEFQALDINPTDLSAWMREAVTEYDGVAVTIPHKEAILSLVDKTTEAAELIGAVNTLYWENEVLCGTNTDCIGALKAIQSEILNLEDKKVLIFGAGGAARAILFALKLAGSQICLWNRTPKKAQQLAKIFEIDFTEDFLKLDPEKIDLVINTTSVGLKSWDSVVPENFWRPQHTAFDIVYDPLETKFLSDAENVGAKTITGDQMLIYQALEQFKIWHGIELEPEIMGRAFFNNI